MNDDLPVQGRAKGGAARAAKLSPEARKAIALKGVEARKEMASIPKATHTGNLKLGEMEIACAVLPDGTRVLSQRGVGRALGRSFGGGSWKAQADGEDSAAAVVPFYLNVPALKSFIPNDLLVLMSAPNPYRHSQGGGLAYGVSATALPQICDVWLKAREAGALGKNLPHLRVAQKAEMIMRGLAHVGIVALVDEATGYQRDRAKDALAKILEAFVAKELQPYLKTFPAEYYEQLFRLYDLPYPPVGNKSWRPGFFGQVTNEVVYSRLAPDLLPELKKAASKAERKAKLHQWLTQDIGHPKLREHLASIVSIMKLSKTPQQFKENVNVVHPRYGDTKPLPFDAESAGGKELSN
ncbi:MAG: P63C domain-containing protein [Proteobacteria bacterium]|nr:P63C domain-containing protein [Pseudomonadota bacterium]MBK9251533.1 P63C domain-containing protein [Pseudomonadota bacterium]MCC6633034.1 P63C domain-containing protein [Gammaproteobacteria bacterium]